MTRHPAWLEIEQIIGHLPRAVDRVMGESGLYDKRTAAKAFRQAEGDSTAAADLVRALRAALPRFDAALVVERHVRMLGEASDGELPVIVTHPATGEAVTIGHVRVTKAQELDLVDGLSDRALLERLRRGGDCGVDSAAALGG